MKKQPKSAHPKTGSANQGGRSANPGGRSAKQEGRSAQIKGKTTHPITKKEDVQQSNDEHIDQDFPGYPHAPAKTQTIHNGSAGAFEGTENLRDDED